MWTISSAEIAAIIAGYGWPMARILAALSVEPVLGNRSVPAMVKVGFALFVTIAVAPALEPMPAVSPASWAGLFILIQEIVTGLAIGFTMRLFYSAAEMAGVYAGLQIGLGFAMFFDPQNGGQMPVVAQFMGILTVLVFLALGGHELVILALVDSFRALPVGAEPVSGAGFLEVARVGSVIFSTGMWLVLPIMATLLAVNLSLGVMTRASPQLNIFAVGFPVTLLVGFAVLMLSLPYMLPVFRWLVLEGTRRMVEVAGALLP